jgi:hypothetical protein
MIRRRQNLSRLPTAAGHWSPAQDCWPFVSIADAAAAALRHLRPQFMETEKMLVSQEYPSRFIKHADLDGKPAAKTITHVEKMEVGRDREILPVLFFEGSERGMVLNRTNARFLAARLGDDSKRWAGKTVELYPTAVDVGGKPIATIRLRMPVVTHEGRI